MDLEKHYSEISEDELIKVYTEINEFNDDAQEAIKREIEKRGISVDHLEQKSEEFIQQKHEKRESSVGPIIGAVLILIIFLGIPGVVFGVVTSSFYQIRGFNRKSKQVMLWTLISAGIKFLLVALNIFRSF